MTTTAKFRIEGEDATAAAFRMALGNAQGTASKMQAIFRTAFAGISVAAIVGVGARAIETGDNLNKAAIKAGVGAKEISELAYAAKMSDIELDSLSTALKKMQVNLSEATSGGKAQQDSLHALGIELKDIKGLAADKQFELIADHIHALKDPADRARAATELFGKAGADLLPMFEQGAEGIRKAREEAERMGLSFNDTQLKALASADDAVKRLKASWEGFAVSLTANVERPLSAVLGLLHGDLGDFKGGITGDMGKAQIVQQLEWQIKTLRANAEMDSAEMRKIKDGMIADIEARIGRINTRNEPSRGHGNAAIWSPGYKSAADEEAAAKARSARLKQEAEDYRDVLQQAGRDNDGLARSLAETNRVGLDLVDDQIDAQVRLQEANAQMRDAWIESDEEIRNSSKKTSDELERNMQEVQGVVESIRGGLEDSLTDLVLHGKANFHDLINYALEEFVRLRAVKPFLDSLWGDGSSSGIGSFLTSIFSGAGGHSAGGVTQAWWDDLYGTYGGPKAMGGPLESGKWYTAGEHGPEPIWGGGPGAFAAGYGGGGGRQDVVQHINIDARGSSVESVKLLQQAVPGIIRTAIDGARVAIMDDMSRRGMLRV